MKKIMMMLVLSLGGSLVAQAQKVSSKIIPASVMQAFTGKFPGATSVKWEMEQDNEYEASFRYEKKAYSANFSSDGKWLETESEAAQDELPFAVRETINREFPEFKLEEIEKADTPTGTFYEISLKKKGQEWVVKIGSDGAVRENKMEQEESEG